MGTPAKKKKIDLTKEESIEKKLTSKMPAPVSRGILKTPQKESNKILDRAGSLEDFKSSAKRSNSKKSDAPSKMKKKTLTSLKTTKFGLMSPLQNQINSAILPKKKLNMNSLYKIRRLSTIGQHNLNKSIANSFAFKDLKELAESNHNESEKAKPKDIKLHGRAL